MNHLVAVVLSFILGAIFQSVLFPVFFSVLSWIPGFGFLAASTVDVLLLLVVYHGLQRPFPQSFVLATFAGVLSHAFGSSWRGAVFTNVLILSLVTTAIKDHIFAKSVKARMILAAVFTFFGALSEWVWGGVFVQSSHMFQGLWGTMVLQMLIHALFAPMIFYLLIQLDAWTLGRPFTERNVVFGEGD